jgi:hypothetical protein
VAAYQSARRTIAANPPRADDSIRRRLAACLDAQRQLATALRAEAMLTTLMERDVRSLEPVALWHATHRDWPTTSAVATGSLPAVTLTARRPADATSNRRTTAGLIGIALLWILVTAATVVGLRRGWVSEIFRRWPHAVGVAIGIGWWLWLWPSPLGLLLVVVSLAAAVRSIWSILFDSADERNYARENHRHERPRFARPDTLDVGQ